ncbi:MAG TPA: CAP domain-containing protein [Candidatus Cloacimonadota bacterium]|nr:CAP domain-containing protein [Candidatus Cloacimonadota bacterium]
MPKALFKFHIILILFTTALSILSALTITEFEQEVILYTNRARADYGLQPLKYDKGLADIARRHSYNMYSQNFYAHEDLQGLQCWDRQEKYYPELMNLGIGENIAKQVISDKVFSAKDLVDGWMNSPGHRANILDLDYTHIGVGVVIKDRTLLATQNFATGMVRPLLALPLVSAVGFLTIPFEYMSSKPREGFAAWIIYPDPKVKFFNKDNSYYTGVQPQTLVWKDDTHFSVTVPFNAGKGDYRLSFGWAGTHYPDFFRITAK